MITYTGRRPEGELLKPIPTLRSGADRAGVAEVITALAADISLFIIAVVLTLIWVPSIPVLVVTVVLTLIWVAIYAHKRTIRRGC